MRDIHNLQIAWTREQTSHNVALAERLSRANANIL
jgi:hypothetical protein